MSRGYARSHCSPANSIKINEKNYSNLWALCDALLQLLICHFRQPYMLLDTAIFLENVWCIADALFHCLPRTAQCKPSLHWFAPRCPWAMTNRHAGLLDRWRGLCPTAIHPISRAALCAVQSPSITFDSDNVCRQILPYRFHSNICLAAQRMKRALLVQLSICSHAPSGGKHLTAISFGAEEKFSYYLNVFWKQSFTSRTTQANAVVCRNLRTRNPNAFYGDYWRELKLNGSKWNKTPFSNLKAICWTVFPILFWVTTGVSGPGLYFLFLSYPLFFII